jgi:hypothetical protein
MKKYLPQEQVGGFSVSGVAEAQLIAEGLKRAGKNLTRESIVEAVQKGGFKGPGNVPLRYSKSDHSGYSGMRLAKVNDTGRAHRDCRLHGREIDVEIQVMMRGLRTCISRRCDLDARGVERDVHGGARNRVAFRRTRYGDGDVRSLRLLAAGRHACTRRDHDAGQ